jgi:Mg2+/citrate symporter
VRTPYSLVRERERERKRERERERKREGEKERGCRIWLMNWRVPLDLLVILCFIESTITTIIMFKVQATVATIINYNQIMFIVQAGNTKGGSITVPLTSCFTGLD